MTSINQLSLSLKLGEIKTHLNASNDGAFSLKTPINRLENSGGVLALALFGEDYKRLWIPQSLCTDEFPSTANDDVYQADFRFGRHRAGVKAPNGTWGNLNLSLNHTDRMVLEVLTDQLKRWSTKHRFHRTKYQHALDAVLANLLDTYQSGRQLLLNLRNHHYVHPHRNSRKISNGAIKKVVNFLEANDLIQVMAGESNEFDNIASWCTPRAALIATFDRNAMQTRIADNVTMTVVRERPKKPSNRGSEKIAGKVITLPESSREWQKLKRSEEPVLRYTELWLSHTATLNGYYLSPWLNRIFIESTMLGGRFYGSYQNLPRVDRKRILIDGKQTVELDFDSLHIAILYAQTGIPLLSDPYLIDGFDRNAIKQVFLRLTNTSNLSALEGQITLSGDPEKKEQYIRYKMQLDIYKAHKVLGLRCAKPFIPEWFDYFIEGLPDHITGRELIEIIKAGHPAIAHRFGEADIGLKLQRVDSEIMARAMTMLASESVPILPVHDSVICRVSDEWVVGTALEQATEDLFGIKFKLSKK
jgi:hypothetical protein